MIACVFSGQGAQQPGMGQELCRSNESARRIYAEAAGLLGIDLLQLTGEQLATTRFAQLSIVTLSLAAWEAFRDGCKLESPQAFAGFSLGEYSAIGAAGILGLPDLLALVNERASLMQQAAETSPGSMFAILGLDDERLLEIVSQPVYAGKVFAVNFNCPGQIVIAGLADDSAACADDLKAAGARRVIKLNVNGAFHTPLMQPAALKLAEFARKLKFLEPAGSFYSNTSGGRLNAGLDWPEYLASHMCNPVHWTSEVQTLQQDGCSAYLEFGPGKVLTGLIRKIVPGCTVFPVEDSITLADAVAGAVNYL